MKLLSKIITTALVSASVFLSGCSSISPGNVGIQISKAGSSRGVQDVTLKTGWVVYNPFITEIIEYPYSMQTVKWTQSKDEGKEKDESITFTTSNSAVVNCDVATSYQLDYNAAPAFYVKFRADKIEDFTDGYFRNVIRNQLNDIGGQYTVEQVMGNNGPMLLRVQQAADADLKQYGVSISNFGLIGACRPPQVVTDSINAKLAQQQKSLQTQQEVEQERAEALKAEARAEGIAKSNLIMAQADAEANRLKTQNLTPLLIQWKWIDRWNGVMPKVQAGSGGVMVGAPKE